MLIMDEINLDQALRDINKEFLLECVRLQAFVAATDPGRKKELMSDSGRVVSHCPAEIPHKSVGMHNEHEWVQVIRQDAYVPVRVISRRIKGPISHQLQTPHTIAGLHQLEQSSVDMLVTWIHEVVSIPVHVRQLDSIGNETRQIRQHVSSHQQSNVGVDGY
ncbi:uncharacterized protein TNCV_3953771 [Trichonephila clavipes]|nr:uncharacterized protein TNCV_3953771 [Trichonephila clavipes]